MKLKPNAKRHRDDHDYSYLFPSRKRRRNTTNKAPQIPQQAIHRPDAQIINHVYLSEAVNIKEIPVEASPAIKIMIYSICSIWFVLIAFIITEIYRGDTGKYLAIVFLMISVFIAKLFYLVLRVLARYYWQGITVIMILFSVFIIAMVANIYTNL